MRHSGTFLFLAAIAVIAASCQKTTPMQQVRCLTSNFSPAFVGYDTAAVRDIKVVYYVGNGQYDSVVDSLSTHIFNTAQASNVTYRHDTIITGVSLHPKWDYRVYASPAGRSWSLAGIKFQDVVRVVPADKPYSFDCPYDQYTLDGQIVKPPANAIGNGDVIYFHK